VINYITQQKRKREKDKRGEKKKEEEEEKIPIVHQICFIKMSQH